ncbi:MAG TPA: AMP-binding protein [Syntrophorhabdaceae bacterium]|nr:AMP-binding protein [Syntrophorhabdaceae bacterium]
MITGMDEAYREKGDTWPKVLKHNCEQYGDKKAMRYKHHGIWQPYTWREYYSDVKCLALGLLSLGFKAGDALLIIGDNAPQWYNAEIAAEADHGIPVGVYSDASTEEIAFVAKNSGAAFAVVADQEQVDKLLEIKNELPLLKKVIYWNYKGLAHYSEPILMGYKQVLELGKAYDGEHAGLFEKNVEDGKADDICALVYTSGTTGNVPKAAVHSYKTIRAGAEAYLRLDPWREDDNVVPYLPPVWINEQWFGIACHLLSLSVLNFAEDPETQERDNKEIGPNIVFHEARLWESRAAKVQAMMLGVDALKKLAFRLFMPVGYRMADLKLQSKKPTVFFRILHMIANIVLLGRMRKSLGLSNARICYTSGATLSPDAFRFYHALDLPLKSIYGTTEGGALTGAANEDIRPETVGPVLKGAEVKITDQGEIIYRQPGMFLGYYKDPNKTAEALRDGWFYSGDVGLVNKDGEVVFLDRKTNLVALTGGVRLAPQAIECRLRSSPYIKDAWVTAGPDKAYVSAVIVINYDTVSGWAGQRRLSFNTFAELAQKAEVYELIKQDVDRINSDLPAGSRVRKFVNLHKEFSPDEGELTRTRKLKASYMEERYAGLVKAIYEDKTEIPVDAPTRQREGGTGVRKTVLNVMSIKGAAA